MGHASHEREPVSRPSVLTALRRGEGACAVPPLPMPDRSPQEAAPVPFKRIISKTYLGVFEPGPPVIYANGMDLENWTDVLRDSKKVHRFVEKEDIVVARRGRSPIRITTEERSRAASSGLDIATRVLAELGHQAQEQLAKSLGHQFPWVRFLPDDAKVEFALAFADTASACASLGISAPLAELVGDWKRTAAIYADPDLANELRRPLAGTRKLVRRPRSRAQKR